MVKYQKLRKPERIRYSKIWRLSSMGSKQWVIMGTVMGIMARRESMDMGIIRIIGRGLLEYFD